MVNTVTIETFCNELLFRLGIEVPEPLDPYVGLYDELGLDSVQAFEAIVITEVLADCMAPPSYLPTLYTLMDAYEYFERCRTAARAILGD